MVLIWSLDPMFHKQLSLPLPHPVRCVTMT